MDTEFDRGIAVRERAPGTYEVWLDDGWVVGAGVNGGYLLAVLGNAGSRLTEPCGHPDPIAVSAHYLSASRPGPGVVRAELVRAGRGVSTVRATLLQAEDGEEVPRIAALATYADLDTFSDEVRTTAEPIDLPPPEECLSTRDAPNPPGSFRPPLLDRFDLRADLESVGWAIGKPSGRGLLQGWFRLADGRDLDPLALLLAVDVLPPTTFDLGMPGWAPTIELTAHVRARPAPGWARLRHRTVNLAGGYFEEDCEVWDSTGRLVAQSRQLARSPRA